MKGFEVLPVPGKPDMLGFTLTDESGAVVAISLQLREGIKLDQVLKSLKAVQKASK